MSVPPLLSAALITKSYAGVRALSGVSFDLQAGEVHALIGENGAGKSTLIKVMTGAVAADSGLLTVGGRPIAAMTPAASRALGIAAIYQQPALFPHLTVAENIGLSLEGGSVWRGPQRGSRVGVPWRGPQRGSRVGVSWRPIDWNRRRRDARDLLERVGASIDPDRLVASLSMPEQQLVEIAKAIGSSARVLIMDEPTASLSDVEVARLYQVIARLRSEQVGIIYISHRLEEVLAIADRVTVLRDGRTVGTHERAGLQRSTLVDLMIGRELSAIFPKRDVPLGDVALELRGVTCRSAGIHDVSLQVRGGEIVGLAGLVGSGRTELAQTVFGLTPADAGEVLVHGNPVNVRSAADAIQAGIGYLPEDRKQHGVVAEMAVDENVSLADLSRVARGGMIDRVRERQQAQQYVDQLRIKTASIASEVESLSGGNQQKVALARWLATSPKVLILDEPTQGVDVGSKYEIHALMQELAERGLAVLMISSELPEILGMSDRIAVMRGGTIAGVLSRDEATQASVLAMALGH